MGRSGESVTRVDIRFSSQMYDQIQQIAVKDGARTHHISQKVEVSPTIVKLVQLGLDALAGKLPDNSGNIPDNISGTVLSSLPDKESAVSDIVADISDKLTKIVDDRMAFHHIFSRGDVMGIVDIQLLRYGLVNKEQVEANITRHLPLSTVTDSVVLSDTKTTLPDIVPDKDVIISDKGASLPDNLPDTENILSDDSSNSESVAQDVQVTPTDAIEQVSGEAPQVYSYSEFHKWVGILASTPNKANGDIAITIAKDKGLGDWVMNSKSRKFTKQTENNQNG